MFYQIETPSVFEKKCTAKSDGFPDIPLSGPLWRHESSDGALDWLVSTVPSN